MLCTRTAPHSLGPKLLPALAGSARAVSVLHYSSLASSHPRHNTATSMPASNPINTRYFTATRPSQALTEKTVAAMYPPSAWPHPVYTQEQMDAVKIAHRDAKTFSDKIALAAIRVLRWGFDLVTGYRHDQQVALGNRAAGDAHQKFQMTHEKWLTRFIFLESIAGVPGMVGGMVRHLHSLRRMRRDMGWIETLIEEAYNERLHLLTFLGMRKPGWFMRLSILGAQGVFFNGFFLAYLISPRTCHRFVGYLEEEAVLTYSRAIADCEAGKVPEWNDLKAPAVAIQYFHLKPDAKMIDVLQHIRADEAKHREVNHTLANLKSTDPNPYTAVLEDPNAPRPVKDLKYQRPTGWEREDVEDVVVLPVPKA